MSGLISTLKGFDSWTLTKHKSDSVEIIITHQHKLVRACGLLVDVDDVVDDAVDRMRKKLASVKTLE